MVMCMTFAHWGLCPPKARHGMAFWVALHNAWGVTLFLAFLCRIAFRGWQIHITNASFAQIENLTSLAIAELVNS